MSNAKLHARALLDNMHFDLSTLTGRTYNAILTIDAQCVPVQDLEAHMGLPFDWHLRPRRFGSMAAGHPPALKER